MANRFLTSDDRRELFEALVTRYRTGEIGPAQFGLEARNIGIYEDDIAEKRDAYFDEWFDTKYGDKP